MNKGKKKLKLFSTLVPNPILALLNIIMILVPMASTTLIGCFGSTGRLGHDDLIDAEDGD